MRDGQEIVGKMEDKLIPLYCQTSVLLDPPRLHVVGLMSHHQASA